MPHLPIEVWKNLAPRPRVPSVDWIAANVKHPGGAAIDFDRVPWSRGVCDAFDDPHVREIALMFSARSFKSICSAALLLCAAVNNPQPMLFGSPTEKLTKRIMAQRLYPMVEQCRPLAGQLPRRRNQLTIELRDCRLQGAWSGSVVMLSDYSAVLGHAAEVDKWDTSVSREGDPLDQFLKRFAEYPDRKILIESSPQEKATSRIYARLLAGDNRRWHIPCPLCNVYQELLRLTRTLGDPEQGGVIWDACDDPRGQAELAYRTARYLCPHCRQEWGDEHRAAAIRRGLWVPEGQHVDRRGRLQGTPRQPHSRIWSAQISNYYSLDFTWGDLASEYFQCRVRPARLKSFVQLTEGWPWERRESKTEPEQLGARLKIDLPRGTCPAWSRFLVLACDVQKPILPWLLLAIGSDEQRHLVDYGAAEKWPQMAATLNTLYAAADGGPPLEVAIALFDSGYRHLDTHRFCRKHRRPTRPVLACKGASTDLQGARYQINIQGVGKNRSRRTTSALAKGEPLVHVAIDCWEEEIQELLDVRNPGEACSLSLCREAAADLALLAQLLNGEETEGLDRRGNTTKVWRKKDDQLPNDYRDALRYALAGAAVYLDRRKGKLPERLVQDDVKPRSWYGARKRRGARKR